MESLKASKAIVIYRSDRETYAEVHNIEDGVFQEGRPLVKKELEVFAKLAEDKKDDSNVEEKKCFPYRHIIGIKSDIICDEVIWIYPTQKQKLFYADEVKGLETGDYWIPNIVFKSDGSKVNVYAIKSADILKMGPDITLYQAPFFNTHNSSSVCMGSARVGKFKNWTEMIERVEEAFFISIFTHASTNNLVKGSIIDAYTNQNGAFNEDLLLPKLKLSKLWK